MNVRAHPSQPESVGRAARGIALTSMAFSALTAGAYWRVRHIAPYQPVVERVDIPLPAQHAALSGLKIGFMTDIHAGPFIDASSVATAAALMAGESPDLLLFGGDFISESPRHLESLMPGLADLSRVAPLGAFAVLGNHDIFVSTRAVIAALHDAGIPVLRNDSHRIHWRDTPLHIVGIDDTIHGRPDLDLAFADVGVGDASLALWHEPEFADRAAARGAILQLSGHSHGGQVRLPGLRPVWLPRHGRKHIMGLEMADGMPVYTSRGIGVYRPPVRLNCPPEVTLITFR